MSKKNIYADHAATTPVSKSVQQAMKLYLENEYGNPSALYTLARSPKRALKEARKQIATVIGASPEEIYFTSGGTEADNWAIKGMAFRFAGQKKKIITSSIEHHAVLNSCQFLEKMGFDIVYLPVDSNGLISADSLKKELDDNTILVSVMLANNEIGTIEQIQALTEITRKYKIPFHTDAVQAVGHIPVNVNVLGVDMLSASAHKFGASKGTGFLYKRKGLELEPLMNGGNQEFGWRAGTENVAGVVGMSVALEESMEKMRETESHLAALINRFKSGVKALGIDCIYNGAEERIPGSISVSFREAEGEMLLHRLDLKGISVSTGAACNSDSTEISHVLKAIKVPKEYINGTLRFSFGSENTLEEVDFIVASLFEILG